MLEAESRVLVERPLSSRIASTECAVREREECGSLGWVPDFGLGAQGVLLLKRETWTGDGNIWSRLRIDWESRRTRHCGSREENPEGHE